MKQLWLAGFVALVPFEAFAQAAGPAPDATLATPTGHEVYVGVGSYTYKEPGLQAISIHGAKVEGDYTGTLPLNPRQHSFAQANVRGTVGNVSYDGWCSPFVINPNSSSPNDYALDVGDASPCSETADKDWYVEGRVLVGKDLIGERWGWTPATGLGLRHLSNGTTAVNGYRTDDYLYLPLALTARTSMVAHGALRVTVEYDRLIHGWQKTRDSELGGGDVPATPTMPAFTVDGFSDVSFAQSAGWAIRASANYRVTRHWSMEPYFLRWRVSASPVSNETATYTVNRVTASELLGLYEPVNTTTEFGVRLGFHF